MSKVASLFGGKRAERKKIEDFNKPVTEVINLDDKQENSKELIFSNVHKETKPPENKPKYIFQAIDKAAERKYIQNCLKDKRLEREIADWEAKNGPALKFDTIQGNSNIPEENGEILEEGKEETKTETAENSKWPSEAEFDEMRERYMKRLQEDEILKFHGGKKAQTELLYYPEICGIPVIQ
ncbi:hypothetical protein TVAG_093590 [Trichomonas vaginalis G3]|uniref:Uncharacterized protein n=1 Tax=Trichomonas vaginalis (strain ATCC PRA-98 / G3) TaxID=412133 RepID=A2DBI2_TRIV3|nr:hypothetical protein TVAGG3_0382200 [Trichomonas vaginalis G3]EAY22185.1 hypothetical protein TVAG_093590 [Trichomonas vaginalis G3]KAI5533357.1 hypothetical protein TVAGG3_0382200 [Trichomonas vaginalis G3]|eukprot:XP_001583171.1 hypothetical protein [Trichomonas vaginalis G3]